jgi:hypothetical protein
MLKISDLYQTIRVISFLAQACSIYPKVIFSKPWLEINEFLSNLYG